MSSKYLPVTDDEKQLAYTVRLESGVYAFINETRRDLVVEIEEDGNRRVVRLKENP